MTASARRRRRRSSAAATLPLPSPRVPPPAIERVFDVLGCQCHAAPFSTVCSCDIVRAAVQLLWHFLYDLCCRLGNKSHSVTLTVIGCTGRFPSLTQLRSLHAQHVSQTRAKILWHTLPSLPRKQWQGQPLLSHQSLQSQLPGEKRSATGRGGTPSQTRS